MILAEPVSSGGSFLRLCLTFALPGTKEGTAGALIDIASILHQNDYSSKITIENNVAIKYWWKVVWTAGGC